jgi:hypothetical protein
VAISKWVGATLVAEIASFTLLLAMKPQGEDMKLMKLFVMFAAVLALLAVTKSSYAGWKGNWYLRGSTECKEINLDRKGRSTIGVYPKSIVEKQDDGLYLTVESMGKKYSYKMIDMGNSNFDLDLISVGPNIPLPEAKSAEGAYSGMFRLMVDCQAPSLVNVEEKPVK